MLHRRLYSVDTCRLLASRSSLGSDLITTLQNKLPQNIYQVFVRDLITIVKLQWQVMM
jgi:hypothetical protein